jgi:diadenosine tetraphosphate (Ap4A) HIT family hydrolase
MDSDNCQGADFCDEIVGKLDVSFARTYEGNPPTRQIVATNELVLVVDLSPLMVGHLLLLPKRHYFSFAQVLNDHTGALNGFLSWLMPTYGETFGRPVILEHGSSPNLDHSACITHAHWHLVPLDGIEINNTIVEDGLNPVDLRSLAELARPPWTSSPYFFACFSDIFRVYRPLDEMRPQYLRSVIGRQLSMNDPEWDYALIVRRHLLRATMNLAGHWRSSFDSS